MVVVKSTVCVVVATGVRLGAGVLDVACTRCMRLFEWLAHAACVTLLIPTNLWLIPLKKTTNPTNPTNPDLQIQEHNFIYLKTRNDRNSRISRKYVWG